MSPSDKSNTAKYLFGGFKRCLYPVQKFASDAERKLAVILERDASRWFKLAKGQFQIVYRQGSDHLERQPDFVAEADVAVYGNRGQHDAQGAGAKVRLLSDSGQTWAPAFAGATTNSLERECVGGITAGRHRPGFEDRLLRLHCEGHHEKSKQNFSHGQSRRRTATCGRPLRISAKRAPYSGSSTQAAVSLVSGSEATMMESAFSAPPVIFHSPSCRA